MNCKVIWFLFSFLSLTAFAEVNSNFKFQFRSKPGATNIAGVVAYDDLLWGKASKEMPLYGYYRLGAVAGGSPTLGAFIEVAPVAPLVFRYQKSTTYRFLKSSSFDCASAYCFGAFDRSDFSVQLAAGYGPIIGVATYLWRTLNAPESSNAVVAEQELFTLTSGEHSYNEAGLTVGYLLHNSNIVGVTFSSAVVSEGNRQSNSVYGIYRWKWNDFDLTAGAGRYDTEQPDVSGSGVLFVIGKKFGDSLSLF